VLQFVRCLVYYWIEAAIRKSNKLYINRQYRHQRSRYRALVKLRDLRRRLSYRRRHLPCWAERRGWAQVVQCTSWHVDVELLCQPRERECRTRQRESPTNTGVRAACEWEIRWHRIRRSTFPSGRDRIARDDRNSVDHAGWTTEEARPPSPPRFGNHPNGLQQLLDEMSPTQAGKVAELRGRPDQCG